MLLISSNEGYEIIFIAYTIIQTVEKKNTKRKIFMEPPKSSRWLIGLIWSYGCRLATFPSWKYQKILIYTYTYLYRR